MSGERFNVTEDEQKQSLQKANQVQDSSEEFAEELAEELAETLPSEEFEEDDLRPDELNATLKGDELLRADGFSLYLSEIRRFPLLTREEEVQYANEYRTKGSKIAARKLVTGNLRLVVKIALEYRRAWVNVMDLIQEGNIGLAEAVKRFNPERGVKFSSFARYWIRALILQFILKNFRLVSFANTRAGRKLFFQLEKARQYLLQNLGEATPKLLAEQLDVSEEEVVAATSMRLPTLSLTGPRAGNDESGRSLSEVLPSSSPSVENEVAQADLMTQVDEKMRAFGESLEDERDRIIWEERLIAEEPIALAVLGDRFNVSRERIRQLESRIKKRLKDYLTAELGENIAIDLKDMD